ncbi:MAG: hypothetical protein WBV84_15275 [Nitrososphaeraceae archaeon]
MPLVINPSGKYHGNMSRVISKTVPGLRDRHFKELDTPLLYEKETCLLASYSIHISV